MEIELNAGRANRVRLNRTPLTRPRDVLGVLRTVLFAPEDLALVKGDPGERRRFLDDLLVAMAPRYAAVRADYERVLKQRTALLKSAGPKGGPKGNRQSREAVTATLDVWDAHLARTGAELLVAREHLVDALRPHVERAYLAVAGDGRGPAAIAYRRSFEASRRPAGTAEPGRGGRGQRATGSACARAEKSLRAALLEVRPSELDRGVCLAGPHRDELELSIRDLPARGYASHGESWSLALALRLASFDLLRAGREDPVLILDDVFAELDAGRRDRLAALVATAEQVLVTARRPGRRPGDPGRRRASPSRPAPLRPCDPGQPAVAAMRPDPERARLAAEALARARADAWARGDRPGGSACAPGSIKVRISNGPRRLPRARNRPPGRPDQGGTTRSPSTPPSAACCRPGAGASGSPSAPSSATGPRSSAPSWPLHTRPDGFDNGELTVTADSDAWAAQVRLMAPQLLKRLAQELGHGTVTRIRVRGPSAPPRQIRPFSCQMSRQTRGRQREPR